MGQAAKLELKCHSAGVIVVVKAQPGAKRNAILGEHAGMLKVAVTAPPEKGRANEAIAGLLAERLGCSKNSVTLISGGTSRQKTFLLEGASVERARRSLGGE
jgi:uncharacterized protein (TIGR00251 family)